MLLPQPQQRLIEILSAEQADHRDRTDLGGSIPLQVRRIDRVFELALLLSEDVLTITILHAADRLGRPRRQAARPAC